MARVPVQTVTVVEKENLRTLEADIKAQLFGQNAAVEAVTAAVKRARAGFRDTEKPEACFLFVGPTGVGKTELAKILASRLSVKLLRYDMSEYQEKYTVSRLIGSAPGYVGYEEGGQLTDAVRKEPHAVVLFDEIEKAHSDIYNILLQVMDYGFLTDNQGRRADFRNCIIIMTSNAGARDIGRPGIGFGDRSPGDEHAVMQNAVEQVFSPEFRNRLDAVVPFSHLDTSIILSIVNKETGRLAERLAAKKVSLTVSPRCAEYLAQKGYSREFGARNIARTVDELIAAPLVDEVLFGRLASGGTVLADLAENGSDGKDCTDRIVFTYG
jgi:ATP-dependent Clp protease ATP-binding subunit ClpA